MGHATPAECLLILQMQPTLSRQAVRCSDDSSAWHAGAHAHEGDADVPEVCRTRAVAVRHKGRASLADGRRRRRHVGLRGSRACVQGRAMLWHRQNDNLSHVSVPWHLSHPRRTLESTGWRSNTSSSSSSNACCSAMVCCWVPLEGARVHGTQQSVAKRCRREGSA